MDINILITPRGMPAEPIAQDAVHATLILDRRVYDELINTGGGPTGDAYLQPGGSNYYFRPGGTDYYIRP